MVHSEKVIYRIVNFVQFSIFCVTNILLQSLESEIGKEFLVEVFCSSLFW